MVCPNATVTGLDIDGGYGEYMLAHWSAVCELPPDIQDPAAAAPLLCAGLTMFNGIRRQSHLVAGDLVAIQGIGGLGHLGIQFAKRMGYRVAVISSSSRKQKVAEKLGADYFIDTSVDLEAPPSVHLQALGGCALVIATAPNSKSMEDLVNGLAPNGRLMVVGADADTFAISPLQLILKRTHVCGWIAGCAPDSEDTCAFAHSQGIQSMNEYFPLAKVQKAYDRMMSGQANIRVVLKMPK
jgi:D-arabinose 1-dehydrogenase-like Zn-dependent alcohol dehydrogenase